MQVGDVVVRTVKFCKSIGAWEYDYVNERGVILNIEDNKAVVQWEDSVTSILLTNIIKANERWKEPV
jgi:hypothetical protein